MQRKASALWIGNMQNGQGEVSTESGTLKNASYSFSTRFGETPGSNPEELLGAAHASCFSMALAGSLNKEGFTPDSLETSALVSIEKSGDGYAITSSRLRLRARVPGVDERTFLRIAKNAKTNCPVSKALNIKVILEVDFHSSLRGSLSAH